MCIIELISGKPQTAVATIATTTGAGLTLQIDFTGKRPTAQALEAQCATAFGTAAASATTASAAVGAAAIATFAALTATA